MDEIKECQCTERHGLCHDTMHCGYIHRQPLKSGAFRVGSFLHLSLDRWGFTKVGKPRHTGYIMAILDSNVFSDVCFVDLISQGFLSAASPKAGYRPKALQKASTHRDKKSLVGTVRSMQSEVKIERISGPLSSFAEVGLFHGDLLLLCRMNIVPTHFV